MTRHQLVADISNAWYDLVEAQSLLQLYKDRVTNLEHNLGLIESAYHNGLNSALDVYLARNSFAQGQSQVDTQRINASEASYRLQALLGRYPEQITYKQQKLPEVKGHVSAGIPAELIARRPELRSSWLSLMAVNTAVAIAHKNRFPRISLTGSLGQSSVELKNLLNSSQGLWSLSGGILQPLFNAGALAAREDEAKANLAKLEYEYRSRVLQILAEVETLLTTESALVTQNQQSLTAEENALAAEHLAFEQYQRGIVDYITVLESQRRAFDAQSSVIQLKRQRLRNRVALYLALGGEYAEDIL